jgi:hypothetical protein
MALTVSLLLLAGGCANSHRAENTRSSAGPGEWQPVVISSGSAAPQGTPAPQATATRASPERHGFTILSFRAVRDSYGQVSVVGEIKNTGSAARGVELQASLRDAGGRLLAVGHFFPASYRNIVPGETWPFTYPFGRQEDAVEAEMRIVGAFRTIDSLNVASTP